MDDDKHKKYEEQYEQRKESLRVTIDACAERSDLDQHGVKAEIARDIGVKQSKVHYVLDEWEHLVKWRRNMMADPLDTEAVKAAYDDDTMKAMADGSVMADGTGSVTVDIEFSLDEAYRAMKLLPGDLGYEVYLQLLESDLPRAQIRRILQQPDEDV